MAKLEGYQSNVGSNLVSAPKAQPIALEQSTKQFQDLSSRLENFSNSMYKKESDIAVDRATKDALNDSANGEPFHKEAVYTAYGKAYNNTLSATYAANADLAINNKSQELSIEFENNPSAYGQAMEEYVTSITKEAPTPSLKNVISLSGQKQKNSTFGKLTLAENKRIKASQLETFQQEWDLNLAQIVNLEAEGNNIDADLLKSKNIAHMGALIGDGIMPADSAQKIIDESEFQITYGVSVEKMNTMLSSGNMDAAREFLDKETSRNREDMDLPQNKTYQDTLTKMYNNANKSQNANKASMKEEANLAISRVIKVLSNNQQPTTADLNNAKSLSEYASLSKQDELNIEIAAYDRIKHLDSYSLPERAVKVNEMMATSKKTPEDVVVMNRAKKNIDATINAAKKDPQLQSVKDGIGAISAINVSNGIEAVRAELPNRIKNQIGNKLEYGNNATQLFTDPEANEWSAYLESTDTPMSEKINFAQMIYETAPNKANDVFSQLRKAGASTYTYAASIAGEGKEETARGILRGQELLKTVGNQPYITEFRETILSKVGNSFINASPDDMNSLVDASLAYSIFLAEQKGNITDLKSLSERKAINDLTNGMHSRNSQDLFLPDNTSDDDFDDWIDEKLTPSDFENVSNMSPDQALLFVRGQKVKINSVGSGKYSFYDGLGRVLMDTSGNPIVLEY